MAKRKALRALVGIAASAGGLEAMSRLAQNLPTQSNCAYVLAQHMSPKHKSMMVELLSRETSLAVIEVVGTPTPEPNSIYVPPPGQDVVIEDGRLVLKEPSGHPATPKPSADRLFKSIADTYGELGVGIVLSGTGSDGSYGVQAIREAGGITIAQEPNSSKYDTMPLHAIETGCVDLTLTPTQIGLHLEKILSKSRDLSEFRDMHPDNSKFADLFQILLAHRQVDFRNYKETTIGRRIHRRMAAKDVNDYDEYVSLCRKSEEEVEALYRDLLISVTSFFRDYKAFEALNEQIISYVEANDQNKFRVWIPGCATGEEAYSVAMLFFEALDGKAMPDSGRLQIIASDLDENALSIARQGRYPLTAKDHIPENLLEKYFVTHDSSIEAIPALRGAITFSKHNVFQDPPFSNIDLITMRNVLIYFNNNLQDRVMERLFFALKPGGLLLLGNSETLNENKGMFEAIGSSQKIFRRLGDFRTRSATRFASPPTPQQSFRTPFDTTQRRQEWSRFDALARGVFKTGFLVTNSKTISRIYGDISPYSVLSDAFQDGLTIDVLHQDLNRDALSLILLTQRHGTRRESQWREISTRPGRSVRLVAIPMSSEDGEERLVLVGIEEQPVVVKPKVPANNGGSEYMDYLEQELERSREALQVSSEELQTSNEELQSANEELQSTNEELQATNEELETTNEELQSTNEELITVNEELLVNTADLEAVNQNLEGLLRTIPNPIMTVDKGLIIRRASAAAVQFFGLSSNAGAFGHLSNCSLPKGFPSLPDICNDVIQLRQTRVETFTIGHHPTQLVVQPFPADDTEVMGLTVSVVVFSERATENGSEAVSAQG